MLVLKTQCAMNFTRGRRVIFSLFLIWSLCIRSSRNPLRKRSGLVYELRHAWSGAFHLNSSPPPFRHADVFPLRNVFVSRHPRTFFWASCADAQPPNPLITHIWLKLVHQYVSPDIFIDYVKAFFTLQQSRRRFEPNRFQCLDMNVDNLSWRTGNINYTLPSQESFHSYCLHILYYQDSWHHLNWWRPAGAAICGILSVQIKN